MKNSALLLLFLSTFCFGNSFYGGIKGGVDFLSVKKDIVEKFRDSDQPQFNANFPFENRNSGLGVAGIVFFGYDFTRTNWSLGVELETGFESARSKQTAENLDAMSSNVGLVEKIKSFYGVALKPAYVLTKNAKIYGKVGLVRGRFTSIPLANRNGILDAGNLGSSNVIKKMLTGYQLGLGILIFLHPQLAVDLGYTYTRYKKYSDNSRSFALNKPYNDDETETDTTDTTYRPSTNNVTLGLVYYLSPIMPENALASNSRISTSPLETGILDYPNRLKEKE